MVVGALVHTLQRHGVVSSRIESRPNLMPGRRKAAGNVVRSLETPEAAVPEGRHELAQNQRWDADGSRSSSGGTGAGEVGREANGSEPPPRRWRNSKLRVHRRTKGGGQSTGEGAEYDVMLEVDPVVVTRQRWGTRFDALLGRATEGDGADGEGDSGSSFGFDQASGTYTIKPDPKNLCCICLEPLVSLEAAIAGESATVLLTCAHALHLSCYNLARSTTNGTALERSVSLGAAGLGVVSPYACPICRTVSPSVVHVPITYSKRLVRRIDTARTGNIDPVNAGGSHEGDIARGGQGCDGDYGASGSGGSGDVEGQSDGVGLGLVADPEAHTPAPQG